VTAAVQRWQDRASHWRPAGELIDTRSFEVAPLGRVEAKAFTTRHHYSGTFPADRFRFGIWRGPALVGVAVFSQPVNDRALRPLPGAAIESVELGRFVLLDEVPGNGETWFLGRAFDLLRREGLVGVVSFSDPVPRRTAAGAPVMPGHVGRIYQAHNGVYVGRGAPQTLRLLPDGTAFSPRAATKIRKLERGWRYAVAQLERHGAARFDVERLAPDADARRAWVAAALVSTTRPLRHRGNHKYVWPLDRRARRALPPALPFPKQIDTETA
jgi:hypothetical protein